MVYSPDTFQSLSSPPKCPKSAVPASLSGGAFLLHQNHHSSITSLLPGPSVSCLIYKTLLEGLAISKPPTTTPVTCLHYDVESLTYYSPLQLHIRYSPFIGLGNPPFLVLCKMLMGSCACSLSASSGIHLPACLPPDSIFSSSKPHLELKCSLSSSELSSKASPLRNQPMS